MATIDRLLNARISVCIRISR